jgi:4'-phosphopantetheinyl transferase
MKAPAREPITELHVWQARLDADGWPPSDGLPSAEQERAAQIVRPCARRRWIASRWALREVLGRYLDREPAEIALRLGDRGKPMLADPNAPLRFNLSHSGELALVAVATGREVGVDVQAIGTKPAEFYAEWTRREAIAKCHGVGLGAALPDTPVAVKPLNAGAGFEAAIAVNGSTVPPLRRLVAEPSLIAQ